MSAGGLFDFGDQRGTSGGPGGFGSGGGAPSPLPNRRPVRAPNAGRWMTLAMLTALAGAVLAAVAQFADDTAASVPLAFTGWFVAGPLAIGLLAVHSVRRTRARAAAMVSVRSASTVTGYWTVLVLAAVGVGFGAWRIADWMAR